MGVTSVENTRQNDILDFQELKRSLGDDQMSDEEAREIQNALNVFVEIIYEKWLADTKDGGDEPCGKPHLR